MIRTPYNKNNERLQSEALLYASQGYVVALQDVRGKFESEGEYIVSAADTSDGSDMVDWLASQPWSTGKVGTASCSYMGENQVEMAKVRNPRHAAMIPRAASGGMQYFGSLRGGAFELGASADWFLSNGIKLRPLLPASVPHSDFLAAAQYFNLTPVVPKVDWHELWRSLPVTEMMKKAGVPPTDWEGFVSHPEGDPWWDQFGYVKETDHFDTPGLWLDSWYDYGVGDIFKLVRLVEKNSVSARTRENQFIVIAPTVHCSYEQAAEHTMVGARDLGDAQFDYYGLYLRWFDYWLKSADNGVTRMPKNPALRDGQEPVACRE
jgi:putative CocE/NonD family hydrolase